MNTEKLSTMEQIRLAAITEANELRMAVSPQHLIQIAEQIERYITFGRKEKP